jgi:hypothetical protein
MKLNEDGLLDAGIHEMEWYAFYDFFSFSPKRKRLLEGLKKVIDILQATGCTAIYIDGSFVSAKLEPGDWDACFDCCPVKIPDLLIQYPLFDRKKQKKLYGGELFSAFVAADEYGTIYLDFFQQQKENSAKKKGIIKINLNTI